MSTAPECTGRVYGCTECPKKGMTIGESFDHEATHRPFQMVCADGYTRRFHTAAEAEKAAVR